MNNTRRLWVALGALLIASFSVLLWSGAQIQRNAALMTGGVLGTLHHLYFVGSPTAVVALGASFSALEVVPLAYLGFEAYGRSTSSWPCRSGAWSAPGCSAS